METVNIGIDLGTTNSLIAKFNHGEIEVFKNQTTQHELLPSAVWVRKDRIFVGEKAYNQGYETQPDDTAIQFKRKMGTSEKYRFKSTNQELTPIELSSMVLKELRSSHLRGNTLDAAVITIPASFDTIQSNATKQAGELAGIRQVVLLQEPIAASLAFVNKTKDKDIESGKWMVYDLGGGTFDVALIEIRNKEMKILDHEGDNFLGGSDLDRAIVDSIILPFIKQKYKLPPDIDAAFTSSTGKYRKQYRLFLHRAEEAKKALSSSTSYEFDSLTFINSDGDVEDVPGLVITRSQFELLLQPSIDKTVELIKKIMVKNSLRREDVKFILMVGGSTYIPLVRSRVSELLNIKVRTDIDPVTAIAVGAAYYAATKTISNMTDVAFEKSSPSDIVVKATYERFTAENEEMLAARITGNIAGLSYRITRRDGGYDSGLKPLVSRINEDLPLEKDAYNLFDFLILSKDGKEIPTNFREITIAHGKYRVIGQPLPTDINIEVEEEDGTVALLNVFPKNQILPYKRTLQRNARKSIGRGSSGEIHINVFEGDRKDPSETCLLIGTLAIEGRNLTGDIRKGMTITVTLEMSEDRTLKVSAEIEELDNLKFETIFHPKDRVVRMEEVRPRFASLATTIEQELSESNKSESFEVSKKLTEMKAKVENATLEAQGISNDDDGVARYQIHDRLRDLAKELHHVLRDTKVSALIENLKELTAKAESNILENGNDIDKRHYADASRNAQRAITTNNASDIKRAIDAIKAINGRVLWRTPDYLLYVFEDLSVDQISRFNRQDQAKLLIESGQAAVGAKDWGKLRQVCFDLIDLLPTKERAQGKYSPGIG